MIDQRTQTLSEKSSLHQLSHLRRLCAFSRRQRQRQPTVFQSLLPHPLTTVSLSPSRSEPTCIQYRFRWTQISPSSRQLWTRLPAEVDLKVISLRTRHTRIMASLALDISQNSHKALKPLRRNPRSTWTRSLQHSLHLLPPKSRWDSLRNLRSKWPRGREQYQHESLLTSSKAKKPSYSSPTLTFRMSEYYIESSRPTCKSFYLRNFSSSRWETH